MSLYRNFHTKFWSDPIVQSLTSDEKLLFIYLFTNEHTSPSGAYELSLVSIQNELNWKKDRDKDKIIAIIEKLAKFGRIYYDFDTFEIAVKNFLKYNSTSSPKLQSAIEKSLNSIKSAKVRDFAYGIDTVSIPYSKNLLCTVSDTDNKDSSIIVSKELKDLSNNTIDYHSLLEEWNRAMEGKNIPQIRSISKGREAHIRKRIEEHGIDSFSEMVMKVQESDFLNGINRNKWVCSFSWCIESPENYQKILEGNYDNKDLKQAEIAAEIRKRSQ